MGSAQLARIRKGVYKILLKNVTIVIPFRDSDVSQSRKLLLNGRDGPQKKILQGHHKVIKRATAFGFECKCACWVCNVQHPEYVPESGSLPKHNQLLFVPRVYPARKFHISN